MSKELNPNELNKEWDEFSGDFMEFAQGPSNFQIEVFMGRGEGPPELLPVHAYRHMLAQIKPAISELRRLKLEAIRLERKQKALKSKISALSAEDVMEQCLDLDLFQLESEIEENLIAQKGKREQYKVMRNILHHLKQSHGEMTNERLQDSEPTYWLVRLARQMIDAAEGNMTGVGSGNINSLRNAVNGSILPDSVNRLPVIPFNGELLKDLSNGSLTAIQSVVQYDANLRKQLARDNRTVPALVVQPSPNQPSEDKGSSK